MRRQFLSLQKRRSIRLRPLQAAWLSEYDPVRLAGDPGHGSRFCGVHKMRFMVEVSMPLEDEAAELQLPLLEAVDRPAQIALVELERPRPGHRLDLSLPGAQPL